MSKFVHFVLMTVVSGRPGPYAPPDQDAADACVACLTLAAVCARERRALAAFERPAFASEAEWDVRARERLIVRPVFA